jgi:hypothetical protein
VLIKLAKLIPMKGLILSGILALAAPLGATIPPLSSENSTNLNGDTILVKMPGYFALELGSADSALPPNMSPQFPGDYNGLDGFWDLKNDPTMKYNLASQNTGLMEWQWGLNNNDGTSRFYEYKAAPGAVTILESNNVRVRLKYSYGQYPFGNTVDGLDCCTTINEYFSIYRPDKIYQTIKFSYTGADGKGPLQVVSWDMIPKVSWLHVSNEPAAWGDMGQFEQNNPPLCNDNPFISRTPSPWLFIWQDPETSGTNKTYVLYSPTGTSAFPASSGSPPACGGAPTPGDISVCTNFGCVPPGISGHVPVKSNFLEVIGEGTGSYNAAATFQYFIGARSRIQQGAIGVINTGTDTLVRHAAMFAGDNGVNTKAIAETYAAEYKSPPVLTMTQGSNQGFNMEMGDFEMTSANSAVDFTTGGALHYPVFNITSWSASVPSSILLNGSPLYLNSDYVAVADNGRLLIQIMSVVPSGARVQISTVQSPSSSILLSTTAFSFNSPNGTTPPPQQLIIQNAGSQPLIWSALSGRNV